MMLKYLRPYIYNVCQGPLKKNVALTESQEKSVQQQEQQKLTNPTSAIRPTEFTRARVQQPHTCPMYKFIHIVLFRLPATLHTTDLYFVFMTYVRTVRTVYVKCADIT